MNSLKLKNRQMRFSVICTNYNKQDYVRESIESVLNQGFTDYEFLIIDDCSTDDSVHILQEYADQYPDVITYLKNDVNQGMAFNYNKLMQLAKGEIVALIDSDDFWFEDKLTTVDHYFKMYPNTVMHQHPLQIFEFSEPTNLMYRPYLLSGDIVSYIKETKNMPLFVATTGLTFKKEIIDKVLPIPVEFSRNGEAFLTRTVICYGDVGVTYKALGGYRKTDSNIVFGNASWDSHAYVEHILKPFLNTFYRDNGFDINFPAAKKITKKFIDYSIRDMVRKILK
jgi:glycosyltransferase involved in cell wall biosynthesis